MSKPIENTVTDAKKSASKFVLKLTEINNKIITGKKEIKLEDRQKAISGSPKDRKKLIKDIEFFKDPSINSLTSMLAALNSYELCNPLSFAATQIVNSLPVGSEASGSAADIRTEFEKIQGEVKKYSEFFRNFTLIPGIVEVTGATVNGNPVVIERGQKFSITLPPPNRRPYPVSQDTTFILRTTDPKLRAQMTGRVIGIDGNTFSLSIDTASTQVPITDPSTNEPALFSKFNVEFNKQQTSDIKELAQELNDISTELKSLGYQDLVSDLSSIPPFMPGIGKFREVAIKVNQFLNSNVSVPASQLGDEFSDASQFLAGGLTSREVLEGSRLFQDFSRRIQPLINFENTLNQGYKDTVQNLNNLLRNAIPFNELSKFVKLVTDFARIIQGVVTMLLVLFKTINRIVKTVTTILKVFNVVIKVIKIAIKVLPAMFVPVGVVQLISEKLEDVMTALNSAIKFLENLSFQLDLIIIELDTLKLALGNMISQGAQLAAKLGSCGALKGNGMEAGMETMVNQLRDTLRGITGAAQGQDYYPNNPNAPGFGLNADYLPDGVGSYTRTPDGEIMFVNDSIMGFDANGNLIFFGDLTSLSTGVNFNDTLGQDFRNRNLKYYTFDKFRNSQADLLRIGDEVAFGRNNRIKEIDPTDRFGNFAEEYRGYLIKIQEELENNTSAQKATRRRGIALDSNEKITVSTELTFSDDLGQIVNEVKFLIDRDIAAGIIGVNTSDSEPNEISDQDAINLAKTVGANPVAINNLEAENNNKAAATLKQVPPTENPTRIGNRPFTQDTSKPAQQKSQGNSPSKAINLGGIAQSGINQFIAETPSLSNLSNNLSTINRATPSQLSNILREPGVENLSEEELVKKLKGEILSSIDPNPEKIEEIQEKTKQWYEGLRSKARADFDQLKLSASIPFGIGRKKIFNKADAYEFEPYISKIEEKELPKWVKLLLRSGYTQNEVDAGLSGEGIRDKYDVQISENGKVTVKKKLAFKEGNF